jgi:2,3-dihydroxy-p-cumate/2,3-dihydroxybenzoate 3,4-dioxygenase
MVDFRYRRLSYVAVATPDLGRSHGFLREILGLAEGAASGNANVRFLRCSEKHHDIMLVAGREPGLVRVSFEMESVKDLESTRAHVEGLGLKPKDVGEAELAFLGIDRAFRIVEPNTGMTLEFMFGMEVLDTPFVPTVAKITNLGHIVIATPNPGVASKFFIDNLNFKMSDGNEWGGLMRPFPSPYHHSLGIVKGPSGRIAHIAFMVEEFDDIGKALPRFKKKDVPIVFGPGRHPASDSNFLYFLDPDGITWEYTFGMEEFPEVDPREPRNLKPGPESMDSWGNVMDPRMGQVGRILAPDELESA